MHVDFDVLIGVIVSAVGIRGCVKIKTCLENHSDFSMFCAHRIFDNRGNDYVMRVHDVKRDGVVVNVDGIVSRTQAELLRGVELFVRRSAFPSIANNEFYHVDLYGMTALSSDGACVGIVMDVLNFGAGDILEICDGSGQFLAYHPFSSKFVIDVDLNNKRLILKEWYG